MNELKEWHGVDVSYIDFTYEHKEQCPKCASDGMDKSHDNLHVYGLDDDGGSLGCHYFTAETSYFSPPVIKFGGKTIEIKLITVKDFLNIARITNLMNAVS